ncbi:MAG: flippase-like domain-containing protein, partial [Candidatus Thermoplasmatota archaeon]|nr:flippase-like domain-containing protein [Candidatus Thermoplasmatota archaeon]
MASVTATGKYSDSINAFPGGTEIRTGTKIAIMALLAILVMLALVLQADPGEMRDLLAQMDLTIIIAVVGLYLLNVFTKVLRWYALLSRSEGSPPIGKVTLYFLIGMAINNSTPGRVSGEPVRAYMVKTGSDYPMGRGMASIFVEKT